MEWIHLNVVHDMIGIWFKKPKHQHILPLLMNQIKNLIFYYINWIGYQIVIYNIL
jgi:hypothetical protein